MVAAVGERVSRATRLPPPSPTHPLSICQACVALTLTLTLALTLTEIHPLSARPDAREETALSTAEYTARFQLQEHLQRAVGEAWAESAVEADAQVGLPPLPLIARALLARSAVEQEARQEAWQEARHAELQREHARLKQLCASRAPELLASFESGARQ